MARKFLARTKSRDERAYPIISRRKIEGLIADGRKIIIVDGFALKADGWLKYHPGGDKAILHMVGRDATDEVNAFVSRCLSPQVLKVIGLVWLTSRVADFILPKPGR